MDAAHASSSVMVAALGVYPHAPLLARPDGRARTVRPWQSRRCRDGRAVRTRREADRETPDGGGVKCYDTPPSNTHILGHPWGLLAAADVCGWLPVAGRGWLSGGEPSLSPPSPPSPFVEAVAVVVPGGRRGSWGVWSCRRNPLWADKRRSATGRRGLCWVGWWDGAGDFSSGRRSSPGALVAWPGGPQVGWPGSAAGVPRRRQLTAVAWAVRFRPAG